MQTLPSASQVSYRKSCRLTVLFPQPPWPEVRKSRGQETDIWGEGCPGLLLLPLRAECDTG